MPLCSVGADTPCRMRVLIGSSNRRCWRREERRRQAPASGSTASFTQCPCVLPELTWRASEVDATAVPPMSAAKTWPSAAAARVCRPPICSSQLRSEHPDVLTGRGSLPASHHVQGASSGQSKRREASRRLPCKCCIKSSQCLGGCARHACGPRRCRLELAAAAVGMGLAGSLPRL